MKITRGLAALILLYSSILYAGFIHRDEVIFIDSVTQEVDKIGKELQEKTGIGLYVVVLKELPEKMSIVDYEKVVMQELPQPAVVLMLSELDKQIDILARPVELYETFDKKQILSPFPSSGTILPILTMKSKKATTSEKFAAAVQNGYTDIAEQIADAKNVTLESIPGNSNKEVFNVLRILFYGFILYALFLFIRGQYAKRKRQQ
ncbi:MAG: 3-dehydroquinate dehydratase [Campylobacterales bacterium]|nr:3-dehydroquinate dehydratase [Campylobacterales bacterium]